MTKLIVICGLPGSGKTTLANELSRRLSIFCLHKDSLKESLYKSLNLSTLEDSKTIGYPSVKGILDLAQENLSRGISVILESPFNFPDEGQIFKEWKDIYNLDLFSIIVQINDDERKRRLLARSRDISHHDSERISSYVEAVPNYDHMPEKRIIITSNQSVDSLVEQIIKVINS